MCPRSASKIMLPTITASTNNFTTRYLFWNQFIPNSAHCMPINAKQPPDMPSIEECGVLPKCRSAAATTPALNTMATRTPPWNDSAGTPTSKRMNKLEHRSG